jgi:hypothetical protein
MKIQVTVTKSGTISNQADFPSMEEAQAWVDSHVGMGSFGSPRFSLQLVEVSPAVIESQEVLNEEGQSFDPPQFQDVEISPAVMEEQLVESNPSGHEIAIVDISAAEAQKAINEQSLKHLAETDWLVTRFAETAQPIPAEILASRAAARAAIIR